MQFLHISNLIVWKMFRQFLYSKRIKISSLILGDYNVINNVLAMATGERWRFVDIWALCEILLSLIGCHFTRIDHLDGLSTGTNFQIRSLKHLLILPFFERTFCLSELFNGFTRKPSQFWQVTDLYVCIDVRIHVRVYTYVGMNL